MVEMLKKLDQIIALLETLTVQAKPKLVGEECPECDSQNLEQTGSFGSPRTTCLNCGVSFSTARSKEHFNG